MEKLKDLYYSPRTGLISAEKLYLKLNNRLPLSEIKTFIANQETYQVTKSKQKRINYKSINVYSINNQWQIDLIDFSKYSKWNTGFKFLLCVVDVYSRKSYVVAIKSKADTSEAMKQIILIEKPILIQSDNGTEFLNKTFQKLLKENKVWHIAVNVGDHNRQGIIERFNRTIEGLISKYQESRNTNRYIDVLDDLVYNYNNTYHRSIGRTPQNMHNENPNEGSLRTDLKFTDIEIGDKVRILLGKSTFQKGYEASFSKEIYTVVSGNGYTFQIANNEGFIIKSRYKYFHLQRIVDSLVFQNVVKRRPLPMTNKELLNKREIDSLEKNILQPLNKKRRQ